MGYAAFENGPNVRVQRQEGALRFPKAPGKSSNCIHLPVILPSRNELVPQRKLISLCPFRVTLVTGFILGSQRP